MRESVSEATLRLNRTPPEWAELTEVAIRGQTELTRIHILRELATFSQERNEDGCLNDLFIAVS